jgi:DNA-3-methyladenine glycosylase II
MLKCDCVSKAIMVSPWISAERALAKDRIMKRLIREYGPCTLAPHKDSFHILCKSIISQQVSNAAAAAIMKRFTALSKKKMTPVVLLSFTDEQLRSAGLSRQKISYLRNLAEHFRDQKIVPKDFRKLTDEQIITELTDVKGIGRWTAEMFLIFALARPDVYSAGDLGLQRAIERFYCNGKQGTPKDAAEIAKRWAPYRSIACWYLWAATDSLPKEQRIW